MIANCGQKDANKAFQLKETKQPAKARRIVTWKMYKEQLAAIQKHIPGNWPISG